MATSGSFDTGKYGGVRGLTFNWWVNSQSVSGNYTDIGYNFVGSGTGTTWYYTLNGYLNVNGSRVFTQNSTKVQLSSGTVLTSGTARIYHNNDGTKTFSADGGATIYNYGTYQTGSGSWALPTIPRQANVTSATDFNDEQNPSITFNNTGGFRLNARLEFSGTSIQRDNIPNTGSYTFQLTDSERNLLRSKCSSNSITVRLVIGTCISGTTESFWSYLDKTMTITNANPTFPSSSISYQDTNADTISITGNNQHIVRNKSNLKITFTSATGIKYASISKYEITFNGTTKTVTSSGTVDLGVVNASQNLTLSIKAIDSRGNSTTATKTVTILDWVLPSGTITAGRVNNYEDETKLKVQVTISSVNSKNSVQQLKYRYKKTTDEEYGSYINLKDNVETELSINKLYAWNFQVLIQDKFGLTTYNFIIAKGIPIMFIDVILKSVGINCFPTKENSFEVEGYDFENTHPINSVIITSNNVNPSSNVTGTWELLTSQTINGITLYYWKRIS